MNEDYKLPTYQVEYLMFLVKRLGIPEYLAAVLMYGATVADYSGEFRQLCFDFTDDERQALLTKEDMTEEQLQTDLDKWQEKGLIQICENIIWLNTDCFGIVPWRNISDIQITENYNKGVVRIEFISSYTGELRRDKDYWDNYKKAETSVNSD